MKDWWGQEVELVLLDGNFRHLSSLLHSDILERSFFALGSN